MSKKNPAWPFKPDENGMAVPSKDKDGNVTSFFGRKTTSPDNDDEVMQTDMGGALITCSKMTYGKARKIASDVDLDDLMGYLKDPKRSCKKKLPSKAIWLGDLWVHICFYLSDRGIFGKKGEYNNSSEYLYNEILKRLVSNGRLLVDEIKINREGLKKLNETLKDIKLGKKMSKKEKDQILKKTITFMNTPDPRWYKFAE